MIGVLKSMIKLRRKHRWTKRDHFKVDNEKAQKMAQLVFSECLAKIDTSFEQYRKPNITNVLAYTTFQE